MAHRAYTDSHGRHWEVWSVRPEYVERRRTTPNSGTPMPPKHERRVQRGFRVPLGKAWAEGWLVFETRGEKRRLAPVPPNWAQLSDAELDRLREQATLSVRPPRRLID